jgi:hypothetical protein
MSARKPHVRVETRTVYVTSRGSRFHKRAAYVLAAKAMIAANCDCDYNNGPRCRFHVPCCDDRNGPTGEGCDCKNRLPHYMRVKARLARYLAFVDQRLAVKP